MRQYISYFIYEKVIVGEQVSKSKDIVKIYNIGTSIKNLEHFEKPVRIGDIAERN